MRNRALLTIVCLLFALHGITQVNCNLGLTAMPVNPSCSNACNGSVILTPFGGTAPYSFNAFDHSFPGTTINTALLDVRNGNFSVSGNQLTATANVNLRNNYDNSVATIQAFPDNGKIVIEGSLYVDYNSFVNFGLAENTTITTQNHFPFAFFFNYGTIYTISEGVRTQVGPYSASTWYDLKIEKLGSTVNYYLRNTGLSAYTLVGTTTTQAGATNYKLAASYFNNRGTYGGFITKNWRVGGNPPTENLCPGTYTYTAYDVNGCFATATVTLGVDPGPTGLQLIGTVEPATCNTASNGSIELVPTGGDAPYTFDFGHVFSGGSINTNIFELRNGNFSQTTDLRQGTNYNNNNSWDNSISTKQSFSDGGFLQMDASFKFDANADVIFGFANTGVIDDYQDMFFGFRISNGSTLFAYTKDQGLISIGSIATNTWLDFRIKRTGNSIEFYTSVHGSGIYDLKHTTIFNTTNIEYKAAALNFANYYSSAGGYNTKGWNVQVTPKIDHLAPGTYTYTITDANGCTATSVFNVGTGGGNGVTLAANLVNGTIGGTATGTVALTPAGGTAPYSYQFVPDFSTSVIDPIAFNLRNGSFVQSNGSLRGNTAQVPNFDNTIYTKASFTDAGRLSISASFSFDNNANLYFGFTENAELTNENQFRLGYYISGQQLIARVGSTNYNITSITANTWYDLKIEKTNALVKFFIRISGQPTYTQVYLASYTGITEFKAGVAMYGTAGGFNTNNWNIDCNPPLTNLAERNYTYRVYDAYGCYSMASVQVPVTSSITLSGQGTNSSAWNINDGSVSLSSSPANNFSVYSKVFNTQFTGTQLSNDSFTIRNGAFSQNNALISATNVNTTGWDNSIVTKQSFANNGSIAVEMEMKFETGAQVYFGFVPAYLTISSYTTLPFAFSFQSGNLYVYSAETGNVLLGSIASNQWHGFRIERTGTEVKFYLKHSPDALYQEVYKMNTTAPIVNYRAGAVNFFNSQSGISRGYSSKSWKVFNQSTTTGLATGNYSYTLVHQANTLAETNVTVGTDLSLIQTMTAPANVVVNTDTDSNVATNVVLGTPTFDGPTAGITVTNNAPSAFAVGNTIVTWTATQGATTITGTQVVTVEDKQAPKVTAPADITVTIFAGETFATGVYLGTATATDNVTQFVSLTNNAATQFNVGTTAVTWFGVDAAGNIGTAIQLVTVVAVSLPPITAPADVTTTTEPGKNYKSQQLINLGYPSLAVPVPGVIISNDAPTNFTIGTTPVTWTISLGTETATMVQYVTVLDDEDPLLNVPADITISTDATSAFASNVNLGTATATDNSGNVIITNDALSQFPIGNTIVTWTATDAAGNTVTKTQVITVKDLVAPSIVAPADMTVSTDVNNVFATLQSIGTATSSDNVAVTAVSNNAPANAQYNIGVTIIAWTATDAAGNIATATQKITVIDNQPPTVTAPADVYIYTDFAQAFATFNSLVPPSASDNIGVVSITNMGVPGNMQFPIGETIITWIVKDAAGNTTTVTQKIIVTDNQAPAITAPADIIVNTDAGSSFATLPLIGNAIASDNSGNVTITNDAPANAQYSIGVNIITWTATDAANYTATATQKITVIDNQAPAITAPANIVTGTDAGKAYATVTLISPVVSDNVAVASVTNNAPANMQFPLGVTIITWTVKDAAGNTSTIDQTITVFDNEAPTISAPADLNISIGFSQTHASNVNLGLPVYNDNVPGATISNNAPLLFPLGTTTVTWTVTDASGKTATAIQNITVAVVSQPPVAKCKPVEITLINGLASVTPAQVNDGSTAEAGIASMTLSKTTFDCTNIGLNSVVFTVTDNNGLTSTCTTTVKVIGLVSPVTITSVPTINTFTGGVSTNLYLGYGAQSTRFEVNAPAEGAPYTYTWTGTGLSSTTSSDPVFTPTAAGNYVFVVTAKNKYGCTTSSSITICVKDIRATNNNGTKNNKKVIVCHIPPGNPSNIQMIEVSLSAVAAHLAHGCSLGTCNQACGTEAKGIAPTEIVKELMPFDIIIGPNPTTNYFTAQIQSSDKINKIHLRVTDAFGRVVYRAEVSEGTHQFGSSFGNGTYYLEGIQGRERKVVKLLKL